MGQRVFLVGVVVVVLGAFGAGTSGAAGTPAFTVTCGSTGFTQVTWQHAKLAQVTFDWAGTNGPIEKVDPVLSSRPKGLIDDSPGSPGFSPTSVTVTFTNTDGSANAPITVDCL